MTTSTQLNYWLRKHPTFIGVFPCDKLPRPRRNECVCFIVNTESQNLGGQHWIAIKVYNNIGFLYDPLGFAPQRAIHVQLRPYVSSIVYNSKGYQSLLSSMCGEHCVFFLYNNIPACCDYMASLYINKYI